MRVLGLGLFSLGSAALVLACMGVYAIVAFSVSARRKEIAIRLALGAGWPHIITAVFGRSLRQLAIGALLGCLLSVGLREASAVMPFAIERGGLGMLAAMLAMVMAAGAAACFRPLRQSLELGPSHVINE